MVFSNSVGWSGVWLVERERSHKSGLKKTISIYSGVSTAPPSVYFFNREFWKLWIWLKENDLKLKVSSCLQQQFFRQHSQFYFLPTINYKSMSQLPRRLNFILIMHWTFEEEKIVRMLFVFCRVILLTIKSGVSRPCHCFNQITQDNHKHLFISHHAWY